MKSDLMTENENATKTLEEASIQLVLIYANYACLKINLFLIHDEMLHVAPSYLTVEPDYECVCTNQLNAQEHRAFVHVFTDSFTAQ